MDSGYEALPQRAGGRHGKRRRPDDANVSSAAANTDAAVTSSIASPAARAAGGAAGHSSVVIGLPDGMDDETLNTCLYEGDICGEECWEYLDHTADVLVHTWGKGLVEAFGQQALAFWAHLVDTHTITEDPTVPARTITASGRDLLDLLFNFLDACLYAYGSDYFLAKTVSIVRFDAPGLPRESVFGSNAAPCRAWAATEDVQMAGSSSAVSGGEQGMMHITAICRGCIFEPSIHRSNQGTEIKAITYSAMQIFTPNATYTAGVASGEEGASSSGAAEKSSTTAPSPASSAPSGAAPIAALAEATRVVDAKDPTRPMGERRRAQDGCDIYVIVDI